MLTISSGSTVTSSGSTLNLNPFDNEEVAAFFDAKLALPENHIRLVDSGEGPNGYVWFEGLRCKTDRRRH
jgi:hypothetical protein